MISTVVSQNSRIKHSSIYIHNEEGVPLQIDFDDSIFKDTSIQANVSSPNGETVADKVLVNSKNKRFLFQNMVIDHKNSQFYRLHLPSDTDQLNVMIGEIITWVASVTHLPRGRKTLDDFNLKLQTCSRTKPRGQDFFEYALEYLGDLIADSVEVEENSILAYCIAIIQWHVDKMNLYHKLRRDSASIQTASIQEIKRIALCNVSESDFVKNPYQIRDIKHDGRITFKTLDAYARVYEVDINTRCLHFTDHLLTSLVEEEGHVCIPKNLLVNTCAIRAVQAGHQYVTKSIVAKTIENNQDVFKSVEVDDKCFLYPHRYYHYEQGIADQVAEFLKNSEKIVGETEVAAHIDEYEKAYNIKLHHKQSTAIKEFFTKDNMFVVTGFPGTGKSSVTACVKYIAAKLRKSTLLCAPTGKAAVRLGAESKTIHRALECFMDKGGRMHFNRNRHKKLTDDIVIIDECSMVDTHIMYHLLQALNPAKTKLLILGDSQQLPSVGPGDILSQLISVKQVPHVRLTKIYRQDDGSKICKLSKYTAMGEQIPKSLVTNNSEVNWINLSDPHKMKQTVLDLYKSYNGNVQILIPNKKGDSGVKAINNSVHCLHFGAASKPDQITAGDKVVCVKNNYAYIKDSVEIDIDNSVFNGETGVVTKVHLPSYIVDFGTKTIPMAREDIDHAYALTVHKSQGSEYDVVILVLSENNTRLLTREVIYTAITRAKKKLYIVGSENSIYTALMTPATKRYSHLAHFIEERLKI